MNSIQSCCIFDFKIACMNFRYASLVCMLACFQTVFAAKPHPFTQKHYQYAAVDILVQEMESNRTVFEYKTAPLAMPASVLKLVTTAAALDILGPDYRYQTRLLHSGQVQAGVLKGDLLIKGSGDPTLGSRHFADNPEAFLQNWVRAIQQRGIERIEGRILVDASLFDSEGVSPFWLWEDIGNYYATGVYGANVFDNSFKLTLTSGAPGTTPNIVKIEPEWPDWKIENRLKAASNDLDSAYLYGAPFQNDMRLFGTMPAHQSSFVIRGQLPNPPAILAAALQKRLNQSGIRLSASAVVEFDAQKSNLSGQWQEIAIESSPKLIDIIRIIHQKSDNFYTECLLRTLAVENGTKQATAQDGMKRVTDYWKSKGLSLDALRPYDACGLSPNNRVSAAFIVEVLKKTYQSRNAALFQQSLPLVGKEGTVANLLKNTPLEGALRLKSGSNQVVNAYAGYYLHQGKKYAVAILINHAGESRLKIRKDIEQFLLTL